MIAFFLTYISAVSGGGRFAFFNHLAGIKQNAFKSVITRILLGISPDHLKTPKAYAATRRSQALEILQSSTITDEIPCPDEAEFREHPLQLSLSGLFCETNLVYSLEEYAEHLQLTKAIAAEHANYSAVRARDNAFANIQILMHENSFVMISKNTAPTVHFVIRHPVLRNAIENLEFPVL